MPHKTTRLTFIHNDGAGDNSHDRAHLVELLERAGYKVRYVRYSRDDLAEALGKPADLIAVGGGDGTVAKVAAMARPDGPPLAILPLGTANNVAKALGLWRPLEDLVAGWRAGQVRPFYPIDSEGPWGRRRLIEGLGFGAIEEAIHDLPSKTDRASACKSYAEAVMTDEPEALELRLPDETISERFAVLEVSTIPLVGPNLRLTAAADPSGRKFAISFIRDDIDERRGLAEWIIQPASDTPVPVKIRAAERATITGRFQRVRIDGNVKTAEKQRDWDHAKPITLTAASEPLPLLVPG